MVLSADAEAFVCIIHTEVDRHHIEIICSNFIAVVSIGEGCIFPVAVLIEDCFAHAKLFLSVVRTRCKGCRISCRILYVHIPYSLVVVEVGSLDSSFALCRILYAVILELVVQRHICKVSGESPGRTIVKTCGSKCFGEAGSELLIDLIDAAVDVIRNLLQGIKILDVIDRGDNGVVHRAVILEDRLVVDDAVALIAVCNAGNLSVVLDCKALVGQVLVDLGILEIVGVIIPGCSIGGRADVEDGRSFALCHLGLKRCSILTVSCGKNGNISAESVVGRCQILPRFIRLRLEVQKINSCIRDFCICRGCVRSCLRGCRF